MTLATLYCQGRKLIANAMLLDSMRIKSFELRTRKEGFYLHFDRKL